MPDGADSRYRDEPIATANPVAADSLRLAVEDEAAVQARARIMASPSYRARRAATRTLSTAVVVAAVAGTAVYGYQARDPEPAEPPAALSAVGNDEMSTRIAQTISRYQDLTTRLERAGGAPSGVVRVDRSSIRLDVDVPTPSGRAVLWTANTTDGRTVYGILTPAGGDQVGLAPDPIAPGAIELLGSGPIARGNQASTVWYGRVGEGVASVGTRRENTSPLRADVENGWFLLVADAAVPLEEHDFVARP